MPCLENESEPCVSVRMDYSLHHLLSPSLAPGGPRTTALLPEQLLHGYRGLLAELGTQKY